MARLDEKRQKSLEPKRYQSTMEKIKEMGHQVEPVNDTRYDIIFKNIRIQFFPYSGWFSGKKPIGSGRGFKNLLKKLEEK